MRIKHQLDIDTRAERDLKAWQKSRPERLYYECYGCGEEFELLVEFCPKCGGGRIEQQTTVAPEEVDAELLRAARHTNRKLHASTGATRNGRQAGHGGLQEPRTNHLTS